MAISNVNVNKLYGALTDGVSEFRYTTYNAGGLDNYTRDIIYTLIPDSCGDDEKAHRAELLIKLAMTDIECVTLLDSHDRYNTYKLVDYDIELEDGYDLNSIAKDIDNLKLPGAERDFGTIEILINAVKLILEKL